MGEIHENAETVVEMQKQLDHGLTTLVVGLSLRDCFGKNRTVGMKLEHPAVVEIAEQAIGLDRMRKDFLRAFDCSAIEGLGYAEKLAHEKFGVRLENSFSKEKQPRSLQNLRSFSIIFTRFEGRQLTKGWREGVFIASAVACFNAFGEFEKVKQIDLFGWEMREGR